MLIYARMQKHFSFMIWALCLILWRLFFLSVHVLPVSGIIFLLSLIGLVMCWVVLNLHYHLYYYFSIVRSVVSFHLMLKDLFVAIVCWLPLELIAWSPDQFVWLMQEPPRCSSSILCCKLMCLLGLLSTLRIVWVAMISICLLLHLVRTLTPLLSSGTIFSTSSQLQWPKTSW